MLENLTMITVVVSAIWLAMIAFYVYTSREQKTMQKDIEALQEALDKDKA